MCLSLLQWFNTDMPESMPLPGRYADSLTDFQRLCVLRCFRVDRIYRAATNFVTERMGERFVTPPVVSFEGVFEQVEETRDWIVAAKAWLEKDSLSAPVRFFCCFGQDNPGQNG